MNILQVMPIIVPHTNNGGCSTIPQWLGITVFVLIALILLVILVMLIRMVFDF